MLDALRDRVWLLHLELPKNGLVTWTGGNVSARDPETNCVVIKPSGVRYEDLRPEHGLRRTNQYQLEGVQPEQGCLRQGPGRESR